MREAQPALEKVEVYLKSQPREPQGRFLKGLVLTEQKKVPEAIQVFTGLTEDFPELPEPYNNLAVLYASQGTTTRPESALELAIHTHPGLRHDPRTSATSTRSWRAAPTTARCSSTRTTPRPSSSSRW